MKLSVNKDLAPLRADALKKIDKAAESARVRPDRLTSGDGQQQEYRETFREAQAFQNDATPSDADYPMLVAERDAQIESGANASATLTAVAADVLAQSSAWTNPIGASIKKARRKGKLLVAQASTPAAIEAAKSDAINAINAA